MIDLKTLSPEIPVLIAGPTASGKSALAIEIASRQGGVIINADALQVYNNWRILSARPSKEDEAMAPHAMYGHIGKAQTYSTGHWLREITTLLSGPERPIIVGGTGLYFNALTQGLAEIPETPKEIRQHANERCAVEGFEALLHELDNETLSRIDTLNPMRVQRAWEVLKATGRPLWQWQDATPAPMLPLTSCAPFLFDVDKEWLNARIEKRFSMMLDLGALNEVRDNLKDWTPSLPSSKAIGAPELIAHLKGEISLEHATELSTIATRQYAKRQRSWFRGRMKDWQPIHPS